MQSKNFKKFMVTGLASVLCAGGMSVASLPSYNSDYVATAYAATIKDTALKATGTVNSNVFLRKGPGTSYSKIVVLKKGSKVDIVAKSSNNWYKVKYGKGFGYVYSKYVTVKSETPTNKEDVAYNATGTVKTNVYVRKTASTSAKKLGVLKKGTEVTIVAKTSTEAWYKVKYNDGYGYVSSKYVTLTSEQPEVQYPATAVANHDVYVRDGGSPKAKKLGAITKGTKVTVVEKCQYNWYKIQYKGGFGYVYGEYLDIVLVQK